MAYVIGSEKGKKLAEDMKVGETVTATDGSTWTKNNDGSISVTHNGQTTSNAYSPTSSGATSGGGSNNPYTGLGTYNDKGVSAQDQNLINYYKQQYNDSIAKGDREAAERAHLAAEAIREGYGYSGGIDGSDYVQLEKAGFVFDQERPTAPEQDPRINTILEQILNRKDFSYDAESDPLYQQYAAMYRREGDRAMKNTMAEAAASAGGMNTYAVTAAQQANNYYNSQLNDKIPELYQLAYEMYLNDKESMVEDLGILQDMDATQYNRYRDTMNDWYADKKFAYGVYRDDVADTQWDKNYNYNAYVDDRKFINSDREFESSQEQLALENERYDEKWDYETSQDAKKWAYDQIMDYISNGVTTISPELMAQAGIDQAAVDQMIADRKAQQAKSGGGRRSSDRDTYDPDDYGDEGSLLSVVKQLGLPATLNANVLADLYEVGAIYDGTDGKTKWANGWSAKNWQSKLNGSQSPSLFNNVFGF